MCYQDLGRRQRPSQPHEEFPRVKRPSRRNRNSQAVACSYLVLGRQLETGLQNLLYNVLHQPELGHVSLMAGV